MGTGRDRAGEAAICLEPEEMVEYLGDCAVGDGYPLDAL